MIIKSCEVRSRGQVGESPATVLAIYSRQRLIDFYAECIWTAISNIGPCYLRTTSAVFGSGSILYPRPKLLLLTLALQCLLEVCLLIIADRLPTQVDRYSPADASPTVWLHHGKRESGIIVLCS